MNAVIYEEVGDEVGKIAVTRSIGPQRRPSSISSTYARQGLILSERTCACVAFPSTERGDC